MARQYPLIDYLDVSYKCLIWINNPHMADSTIQYLDGQGWHAFTLYRDNLCQVEILHHESGGVMVVDKEQAIIFEEEGPLFAYLAKMDTSLIYLCKEK